MASDLTVALALLSPAQGPHLISAIGDYGGFTHWDLDKPAPEGSSAPPRMGNTTGLDAASIAPQIIVRVGDNAEHKPDGNIGYSLDSGRAWQPTAASPAPRAHAGSVAVSADGATWVWTPDRSAPFVTRDHGATWQPAQGLATGQRVIADPVNPHVFYALSPRDAKLLRSSDSAATFTAIATNLPPVSGTRGDPRGGQDRLYATPGRSGDLWFAAFDGLYRAQHPPSGSEPVTFTKLPGVDEIHAFGFGKAAPGSAYPTLYLVGAVHGQPGIFRSLDRARTWVRINDNQHQWGLVLQIAGDPRIFGRVYVGTHGRGIFYGDPAKK